MKIETITKDYRLTEEDLAPEVSEKEEEPEELPVPVKRQRKQRTVRLQAVNYIFVALVFLLAAFLASEGVKNYNIRYAYLLFILGAGQLIRIFIYPMKAHDATVKIKDQAVQVMGDGQFMRVVLYLVLSAACCFAAGVVGASKSKALSAHLASMSEQTK